MAADWKVISTVPITGFDASNRPTAGNQVTYQLTSGATGNVFVPGNITDPAAMKQIIQEDADRTATLSTLTSSS